MKSLDGLTWNYLRHNFLVAKGKILVVIATKPSDLSSTDVYYLVGM